MASGAKDAQNQTGHVSRLLSAAVIGGGLTLMLLWPPELRRDPPPWAFVLAWLAGAATYWANIGVGKALLMAWVSLAALGILAFAIMTADAVLSVLFMGLSALQQPTILNRLPPIGSFAGFALAVSAAMICLRVTPDHISVLQARLSEWGTNPIITFVGLVLSILLAVAGIILTVWLAP